MGSAIAAASFPLVQPRLLHRRRIPSLPHSCNPNPKCSESHPLTRRDLLFTGAATTSSLLAWPAIAGVEAAADGAPAPPEPAAAAAITDRVFIDFSLCPSYLRSDRTIGASDLAACPDPEPLGRVVFGLYGKLLPITVANFKTMCTSAAYRGALVHKVLQGEYFAAGRQGRREKGEISPPPGLAQNTETVNPGSFQLKHLRPGTLSLCLSENDDYDEIKLNPSYRNVEFMVTTGPGPCPQLDGQNIVFGTVLEGMPIQFRFLGDQQLSSQRLHALSRREMNLLLVCGSGITFSIEVEDLGFLCKQHEEIHKSCHPSFPICFRTRCGDDDRQDPDLQTRGADPTIQRLG